MLVCWSFKFHFNHFVKIALASGLTLCMFPCSVSARFVRNCLLHALHASCSAILLARLLSICAFLSLFLSSQSFFVTQLGSRHIRKGLLPCWLTCIIGVLHSSHCLSRDMMVPSLGSGNPTLQPFL